ncbi:MAG: hypothetical protein QOJ07_980 [Thermoleophilaceae bacterium]|nr:hypothetical protein [Thermoleophilaceae bacterium]
MSAAVIRGDDAPRFGQDGTEITGYAAPSRGSAGVAAWRLRLHPGAASPLHELTAGEAFLVLSGRGSFEVAGERHEVGAGDAICVPPGARFKLANEHDEPFEAIACMPAGGKASVDGGDPFVPPWAV